LRSQETIETCSGTQVQDYLSFLKRSQGYRITATQAQVSAIRDGFKILIAVANIFAD
jgi:hypothetical protein